MVWIILTSEDSERGKIGGERQPASNKGLRSTSGKNAPSSCKPIPTGATPVVDLNKCEAKGECVRVCPYDVFEIRVITREERSKLSLFGKIKSRTHGERKAFVVRGDSCHTCGLCVTECPEGAIKLFVRQARV